jgi:hypothetical protein
VEFFLEGSPLRYRAENMSYPIEQKSREDTLWNTATLFVTGSHYVIQANVQLQILPPPPECWDYRLVPQYSTNLVTFWGRRAKYWGLNSGPVLKPLH